uniref:Uncharacterized protein n=1 Tax=Rhizophora mucronata TaxID=61149 RepID=A0A2P2N4N6_RHIMU
MQSGWLPRKGKQEIFGSQSPKENGSHLTRIARVFNNFLFFSSESQNPN